MKKFMVMAFIAAGVLAGAQTVSAETIDSTSTEIGPFKKAEKKVVVFQTNIHCANCAKKVKENISFEKGVTGLEVEVDTKIVRITYDPAKTSVEKLAAAIKKLGYTAEVI